MSILPSPSKVLEKVVVTRVENHMHNDVRAAKVLPNYTTYCADQNVKLVPIGG